MEQRGITKDEVELTFRDPEITRPGNEPPARTYQRHVAGRYIKVVAIPDNDVFVITTAVIGEEG